MKVAGGKWEWGVINFFSPIWGGVGVEKNSGETGRGSKKNLVTQIKMYPTPPPHTHT